MGESNELGQRLRKALADASMTSAGLASAVSVSATLVSLWLSGHRRPSETQVKQLAAVLKVDVAWLQGRGDSEVVSAATDLPTEWFFRHAPDDGGRDYGNANVFATPADLRTLVRETGQNSLDAALGVGPVTLRYSVRQLQRGGREYDAFLQTLRFAALRRHIAAAAETDSKLGTRLRGGLERLESADNLTLLRIDDYGTTGLYGDDISGDVPSPFAALVRNNLDSSKRTTTAGGSFGVGKAVLWRCSDLSTVLFATKVAAGFPGGIQPFRFIGKTELTWHKVDETECAGPGWIGSSSTAGQSAGLTQYQLRPMQLDRTDLPLGVDANRDSGTSILIIGFSDPESPAALDPKELAERLAAEAARNFWPAIQRGRLRVVVDAYSDTELLRSISVPEATHIPELRDSLQSHDNDEVVGELREAGDVVRVELPIAVPAVRPGAKALQHFDELTSSGVLLVRLATGDELRSPELNSVALVRGRGMVVKYWKRQNLVVGAQPFHAVLLVGEFAGVEPPQVAAEQFFRLAEPPAHDEWRFNEDLREKYDRGAKSRLEAIFYQVETALRAVIRPPVKAAEEGPTALKRLLQLNVAPAASRPAATLRNIVDSVVDGRWVIEGDIHINEREASWAIAPRLWLRTEDKAGIRVSWAELVAISGGDVTFRDNQFLTTRDTKRFRFRAISQTEVDGIRVSQCRAELDIAAVKRES